MNKKFLVFGILMTGVLIAGAVLFLSKSDALAQSTPTQWTEKVGEGIFAPACNSAGPPLITCVDGSPQVTVYWNSTVLPVNFSVGTSYGNWDIVNTIDASQSGSYTGMGANNTTYWYGLYYYNHMSVNHNACEALNCDIYSFTTPNCAPPTVDVKANGSDGPISIPYNTSATLSWTAANANSCTASGGWSGSRPTGPAWPATTNWNVIANGYPGSLVLRTDDTGAIFDEPLNNVVLDGTAISFTRPGSLQNYTGTLQSNGANIIGTFTYLGSSYNWSATIIGSAIQWSGSGSEPTGNLTSSQTYTLSCTSSAGIPGSDSVTVNVGGAPKSHIVLSPTSFSFSGVSGGATPAGQTLNISNTGNAALNWTGSTNQGWCHLSSSLGSIAAGSNSDITVSVDAPSNVGSFNCVITISGVNADNSPQTASVVYTVSPPAPIASLSANPTTIEKGESSTLSWSSTNATSCSIDQSIGTVATSSLSLLVYPSKDTTYTLTCTGPTPPPASSSATIIVLPPFKLEGSASACNTINLSWTPSAGAIGYRIYRGSPRVNIAPYQPYTALNFTDTSVSQNTTYKYQIEAYDGKTRNSNTKDITTPYCPPSCKLSGNPLSIYQGQTSTLTWKDIFYATSCTASGAWSGFKSISGGSEIVTPAPPSATYYLTCSGNGGSTQCLSPTTVNVSPLALPGWKEIIPR